MTHYARYQFTITDENGNIVPSANVEVRIETAGTPLATIYSDREGNTPLGNPFQADSDGYAAFHAAGGAYRIRVVSGAFERIWRYVAIGLLAEQDIIDGGSLSDDSVTFAKMQNISTDRLIGRDSASSGDPEEISVGGGLEFTGSGGIRIANDGVTFAKMQNISTDRLIGRDSASSGDPEEISLQGNLSFNGSGAIRMTESFVIAVSNETTALSAGTGKIFWRMPYAFTVTAVRASLTTAQTSGNIFTVDINENGTSILSTKLTIDNNEKTSTTAATAAVISDASLADDAEMSVDIDQIGDGTAKGLKIYLIGYRT
jgi:hypothetical protein